MRLLGIGLALPGMVDIQCKVLVFSPNLQWRDVPLGKILAGHSGSTVYIDNDANASALGEHLSGVAKKVGHDVLLIENGPSALAEICGVQVQYQSDSALPAITSEDNIDALIGAAKKYGRYL
jgi:hypothetical protein